MADKMFIRALKEKLKKLLKKRRHPSTNMEDGNSLKEKGIRGRR